MKQLFITSFLPQKNAPQAGHRLAYEHLLQISAESEVDVVLISRLPVEEKDIEFRAHVGEVHIRYVKTLDLIPPFLADPFHFAPRFFTRHTKAISNFICDLIEKNQYDTVRLEFSQCFSYVIDLRRRFGNRIKIVLGMHDVLLQVVLRLKSIEGRMFLKQTFEFEQRLLKLADKVLVLSNKDAQLVQGLYPGVNSLEVIPIAMPAFLKDLRRSKDTVKKGNILFWGAMKRRENEEAVLNFVETIFLPLRRRGLPLKLFVVGSDPGERVKRLASDDICVTGFVEDPRKYFEAADIGVVPLLSGAGIKLKTLEMLAAQLPVVSTPLGAEGIERDGNLLNVCEIDQFADVVERIYLGGMQDVVAPEALQA
ncbi:Glycosyltransferase involved in cell wall bisynthesis [Paraburkholderia fungorum]|uniref:Glycosyltransferase involved in cell wall bisynthesis n=1 Tax=Paraburkholderia fungorum TaxID=134537 RepID=A0A1H0ZU65_9BURK|nr:glycosyltransferase [Paraburkholderia fungorum]SDQ30872.1 Glycosyltransferase involved in cell wall bisynthesis [Paraburkholderia fungorum]